MVEGLTEGDQKRRRPSKDRGLSPKRPKPADNMTPARAGGGLGSNTPNSEFRDPGNGGDTDCRKWIPLLTVYITCFLYLTVLAYIT